MHLYVYTYTVQSVTNHYVYMYENLRFKSEANTLDLGMALFQAALVCAALAPRQARSDANGAGGSATCPA